METLFGSEPSKPKPAPRKWPIPPDRKPVICASPKCGEAIYWVRTLSGRSMPVNPDGTSHFNTCVDAPKFRKPKE